MSNDQIDKLMKEIFINKNSPKSISKTPMIPKGPYLNLSYKLKYSPSFNSLNSVDDTYLAINPLDTKKFSPYDTNKYTRRITQQRYFSVDIKSKQNALLDSYKIKDENYYTRDLKVNNIPEKYGNNLTKFKGDIGNILINLKNSLDTITYLDNPHALTSKISTSQTNLTEKNTQKITHKYLSNINDIINEFNQLKKYQEKLIQNKHIRERNLDNLKKEFSLDKSKVGDEYCNFKPNINKKSVEMASNINSINNPFERLYIRKQNNVDDVDKYPYKPEINSYSIELLKSNNKLLNHKENLENNYLEYKRKTERLEKLINEFYSQYSFSPNCNSTKKDWKWDKFLKENEEFLKLKEEHIEKSLNEFNSSPYPEINSNSIKILFDGGLLDLDHKKLDDIDVNKSSDRQRLYKIYNDFHLRIYDEETVLNKANNLKAKLLKQEMSTCTPMPTIDEYSRKISLNKRTYLESIKIYSREKERQKLIDEKEEKEEKLRAIHLAKEKKAREEEKEKDKERMKMEGSHPTNKNNNYNNGSNRYNLNSNNINNQVSQRRSSNSGDYHY